MHIQIHQLVCLGSMFSATTTCCGGRRDFIFLFLSMKIDVDKSWTACPFLQSKREKKEHQFWCTHKPQQTRKKELHFHLYCLGLCACKRHKSKEGTGIAAPRGPCPTKEENVRPSLLLLGFPASWVIPDPTQPYPAQL